MEWAAAAAAIAISAGILYASARVPVLSLVGFAAGIAALHLAWQERAAVARFSAGPTVASLEALAPSDSSYVELDGGMPVWERTLWIEEDYVSFSRAYVPVVAAGSEYAAALRAAREAYRSEKGVESTLPLARVPDLPALPVLVLSRRHRSEFRMRAWLKDERAARFVGAVERRVADLDPADAARIAETFPASRPEETLILEELTAVPAGSKGRAAAFGAYGVVILLAQAAVLLRRRRR